MVIGLVLTAVGLVGGALEDEEDLWALFDDNPATGLSFAVAAILILVFVSGSGNDIATEFLCGAMALWNTADGLLG